MPLTETIKICNNLSVDKNASVLVATPVHLGKCGPNTKYWVDLSASGGGDVKVKYQVGDTPDDTFYTHAPATVVNMSSKSSIGTASRDRVAFTPFGTPWMKFKIIENNASPVVFNMTLILSQE